MQIAPAGTDAGRRIQGGGNEMSQGPRGGWVRVVFAGVGALVFAGALGCMNTDKPKGDTKPATNTKQPTPGLPGTPTLPGTPGSGGGMTKTGQQPYNPSGPTGTASGLGTGPTGFQQPGFQQPGFQQTGFQQTGFQQTGGFAGTPTSRTTGQPTYNTGTGTSVT